jgi:hypothetical protein
MHPPQTQLCASQLRLALRSMLRSPPVGSQAWACAANRVKPSHGRETGRSRSRWAACLLCRSSTSPPACIHPIPPPAHPSTRSKSVLSWLKNSAVRARLRRFRSQLQGHVTRSWTNTLRHCAAVCARAAPGAWCRRVRTLRFRMDCKDFPVLFCQSESKIAQWFRHHLAA